MLDNADVILLSSWDKDSIWYISHAGAAHGLRITSSSSPNLICCLSSWWLACLRKYDITLAIASSVTLAQLNTLSTRYRVLMGLSPMLNLHVCYVLHNCILSAQGIVYLWNCYWYSTFTRFLWVHGLVYILADETLRAFMLSLCALYHRGGKSSYVCYKFALLLLLPF